MYMGTLAASRAQSAKPPEILLALEKLPPFPTVALRAMNVLSGTDTSLSELCDLVRADPVFTGEILRIANSPLIAFSKEVTSILQASMLLGFRRLRRVVITVGLRSYMDKSFTPALRSCWRHCVASAMVAERIARWNLIDSDFAYTAGILHDIGRVALASLRPEEYSAMVERAAGDPNWNALEREQEVFGLDHCSAGRMLIQSWKLPETFLDTTCAHHEPLSRKDDPAEVIRLSCLLADALGFAAVQHCSIRSFEQILIDFPESIRKHMLTRDEMTAEIAKEIQTIESA
ncbi:MAG: HDOD domain-containing protein [Acidobacteria bacterium]|nr:HDOD domain-containing protein [Acidobacteriota bacterium]